MELVNAHGSFVGDGGAGGSAILLQLEGCRFKPKFLLTPLKCLEQDSKPPIAPGEQVGSFCHWWMDECEA